MAGNVITVLPVLLAFLLAQRIVHRLADVERGQGLDADARIEDRAGHEGLRRRRAGGRRRLARRRGRRVHGPGRSLGLRQVDPAADDRRARAGDQGQRVDRRRRRDHARAAATATSRWSSRATRSTRTRPCARTSPSACAAARSPSREIAERVDRMAAMLGLGELMDRKPAALSGGQRQRVAMGRALVREPRGVPDGRAALQPRREAAHEHARRARPPARAAADDHGLRHPRPGRGDDARRSGSRCCATA